MTNIEWTHAPGYRGEVWNPVTGCRKISAGCQNCYAEALAKRFWGARKFTDVRCHPERLMTPLKWRKPRRIFVNSMSDLFHEAVPDSFILDVLAIIERCPQHQFLILTKRPERMRDFFSGSNSGPWMPRPALPNLWLGVSIEDQTSADARIPVLLECAVGRLWISYEPMLGPVDLSLGQDDWWEGANAPDWIVCGGESGPNARPCEIEWIRNIVAQCREAAIPVFVKQDNGPRPGLQGRIPDSLWIKEIPG